VRVVLDVFRFSASIIGTQWTMNFLRCYYPSVLIFFDLATSCGCAVINNGSINLEVL